MISACVLRVLVIFTIDSLIISKESEATYCEGKKSTTTTKKGTTEATVKYCCKIVHYIDRQEEKQFYCPGGCCGDKNDEYCCTYINEEALPYVIGFSIFGVVVVVVVGVILFFVFRKACKGFKEYKEHKTLMTEVYKAKTLDELLAVGEETVASPPNTVIHQMVTDDENM